MEFMNHISPIQPLWEPLSQRGEDKGDGQGSGLIFADIFRSAVDNVRQTSDEHNRLLYGLATGQVDNPAEVSIAAAKASTASELLIQLRNKAMDAYSELMRMSL